MAELIDEATDQVHGLVGSRTDREERSEVCGPCKGDNDIQPATGWCETCDEMLCKDCYKAHRKQTMTRNHQLRSLEELTNRKKTKKIESKCMTHKGRIFEYFCEDHSELGCSQCFVTKHRPCSEVVCISEVKTSESNEFKAMQLLLSKLEERLNILEEKRDRNLSITGRQYDEAIVVIREAGEHMKALIDTFVKEQIAVVVMTKDDNIRNIEKVDGMKKEVEEQLASARDMLAAAKEANNQLFITMKHLQVETHVLESKLGDSEQKNTIKEYEFVLNPELARLLDTMTELGTLKDTLDLNMDKATDEVGDELELARFLDTMTELGTLKDTLELNMDKATDEVGDELEVRRLHSVYSGRHYHSSLSDAIEMSTDRDIRLLYVLLYPCYSGDGNVKLSIKEGSRCLTRFTSSHLETNEEFVAVKVIGDGGVHGITLQAGHRYDIVVTLTGVWYHYGRGGLSKITTHGVNLSFSNSDISSRTDVSEGHIPGFRFSLL